MDKKEFKLRTEHLLKYSPRFERDMLKPQTKTCEYCSAAVTDQRITCDAYRLGTEKQYFKHTCRSCKFVLYDGSFAIEHNRHIKPTAPQAQVAPQKKIETKRGRRKGRSRAVQTPAGRFGSLTEVSKYYDLTPSSMLYRMQKFPHEFYYVE